MSNKPIIKFKINGLGISEKDYLGLSFGHQIEYSKKIATWMKTAKVGHVSQKRTQYNTAIREFISLNKAEEYYCKFHSSEFWFDDTFEIYWK